MVKKANKEDKELLEKELKFSENILNKNRIIFLYSEINEDTAKEVNMALMAMHILDKKAPIMMEINSPGGSCLDGLSIIDTMVAIGNPIYTNICGEACSMATYVAMCGTKRFMTKNSYWLAHPMASWSSDYINFMKDRAKFTERLDKTLDKIYRKYTKLTKADFNKFHNGELWLNASQCKRKGIIDRIT